MEDVSVSNFSILASVVFALWGVMRDRIGMIALRALQILEGTKEIMQIIICRALLTERDRI